MALPTGQEDLSGRAAAYKCKGRRKSIAGMEKPAMQSPCLISTDSNYQGATTRISICGFKN